MKIINYNCFIGQFIIILIILNSCKGKDDKLIIDNNHVDTVSVVNENKNVKSDDKLKISSINMNRIEIKLSHSINTSLNEYLPIIDNNQTALYFSAMDRTGFFDFKVDYTKAKNSGGEDIYQSKLENGVWKDARPISFLNTNSHEVVTDVLIDGSLLLTANYPEKFGPKNAKEGTETTDLFVARKKGSNYQLYHLPEPVNSIYGEFDAVTDQAESFILFTSDRPNEITEYHKKGWSWNENLWGNTDVYVSLKDGDSWGIPINLGVLINSAGAERTPWLSKDGLTLYISSNGYKKSNNMDVYSFKRKSVNDWGNWEGPFEIKDANTVEDDWGYKETNIGVAYLARVYQLGFTPTQGGYAGDGGIRETNYRTGHEVFGAQSASFKRTSNTDIITLLPKNTPIITLSNVLFEFNSHQFKSKFNTVIEAVVDLCNQNKNKIIQIQGFTDNIGDVKYNLALSRERAIEIKNILISRGTKNEIQALGKGMSSPLNDNTTDAKREKNRRVEIFFN